MYVLRRKKRVDYRNVQKMRSEILLKSSGKWHLGCVPRELTEWST